MTIHRPIPDGTARCDRLGHRLAAALAGTLLVTAAIAHTVADTAVLAFLVLTWLGPAAQVCRVFVARCAGRGRPVRVAVIGSAASADTLERELRLAGMKRYVLVGRIGAGDRSAPTPVAAPLLGDVADVAALLPEHGIDLLLMTGECGRLQVFEAVRACLHLPVRLVELSVFYEEAFGHVPAAEINAAWFQYLVHPSYAAPSAAAKRALDIAGAVIIGIPFLVLLGILAPVIRRDGGPVFFWQTRVGEGGRPLRMCKLRTMRVGSAATWAAADDPRVTPVGGFLRRTHIDELPQLLHVLRGEMSLVGPRPEQPHLVEQLERDVPFYSSRHLIRPGIAGWAQLRCGYAGSDVGSAWKLCHDLYYLKHRSLGFDLSILCETVRTVFADPHRVPDPTGSWFILGRERTAQLQPVAVADQLHLPVL
ncbi:MAG TPA: sugar transferase [Solirubrobacteraceae bacterium]|nr:sugar transferase [Solirubrobacteraceae bacterium]